MKLPNKQRQHRTLHIHTDVLPYMYALCQLLCPVSAALARIFRMDSISTSKMYRADTTRRKAPTGVPRPSENAHPPKTPPGP
jgi:hypothetical protein